MSTVAPVTTGSSKATTTRLESIDLLRGIVMILMALDHTRDYFFNTRFDPLDASKTDAALYFTRWFTHFCAPVFAFLVGAGSYLYGSRRTTGELSRFLLTRGLWLILLELTVMRTAWAFNVRYDLIFFIVLWSLGCSMVALAGLAFLPVRAVGIIGIAIVCLHNLTDGIAPKAFGSLAPLWTLLHVPGFIPIAEGRGIFAAYPILPWIGIVAAGYAFGSLFKKDEDDRRRIFIRMGLGMIAAFVVIRAMNIYGDNIPWSSQPTALQTLFTFLNTQKYPPSLLYTLMTLGPAILFLGLVQGKSLSWAKPIVVYGRVPMLYYVTHVYLIHGLAAIFALSTFSDAPWMFKGIPNTFPGTELPPTYGVSLGVTYLIWIAIVLALYPLCKWFAGVKERRRDAWLSYL